MAAAGQLPTVEEVLGEGGRLSRLLPNYEFRTEQISAAHSIEMSIKRDKHCVIEAGTGVGKSLAYLVPVALSLRDRSVAVVSTYTINLQTQLIEKDIPLLAALVPEVALKPCLLKGRGNYLCKQDLDAAQGDMFHTAEPRFRSLLKWAASTKTGDSAELSVPYPLWHEVAANGDTCRVRECRYFDRCHYFAARKRAMASNLIVVNHALLLTDVVARGAADGQGLLPAYDTLVIDEAHHLEEAATSAFGVSLAEGEIPALAERVQRARPTPDALPGAARLISANETFFGRLKGRGQSFGILDQLRPDDWSLAQAEAANLKALLDELRPALDLLAADAAPTDKERIEGLSRTASRLSMTAQAVALETHEGSVKWCDTLSSSGRRPARHRAAGQRVALHDSPVEVQRLLNEHLWSTVRCCILTSATLANSGTFDYLRTRLGLPAGCDEHIVGSPFDFATQALFYVPAHLPPPTRELDEAYLGLVVDEIERIVDLTKGRAFLLFTSRKALEAVYSRLRARLPFPLFRQGDKPPAKLLQAFRESGDGCLLGNQTFWEGVDVQGEALSAVVIDRIPFAVPDSPITKARTDALTEAGRNAFLEFSLPQAQIRLKQGFGRLIRTHADRGIVCVLDSRLLTKWYGPHFVEHLPRAARASVWARVERFWNR